MRSLGRAQCGSRTSSVAPASCCRGLRGVPSLGPLPPPLGAQMPPPSSGGGAVVSPGAWGGARALWLCVRFPRVCGSQTPNLPLGLFKGFHFLCIVRIFSVPIQWYNKCPDSTPPPSCP